MSRYDGLIIPRSYSEYINKTDAATLQQALQLNNVLAQEVAAGNNKAVTSNAVNSALGEYINKTDAATLQQALQLPGVLSGAVAAGDNKAVTSNAVNSALGEYINKTDAATLQQALQLPGVLSGAVAAGDNKAVTSNAVNSALGEYINKRDAATLQQALQLPGVLSGAVAAGDNKAVTSNAVKTALEKYNYSNATALKSSDDFNNIKSEGYYYCNGDIMPSNYPPISGLIDLYNFILHVYPQGNTGRIVQEFTTINGQHKYIRFYNLISWSEWGKITTDKDNGNDRSVSIPKNGTVVTSIAVNAGATQRTGFLLMIEGNFSNEDATYCELYLIRVGYSGNHHTETLIHKNGDKTTYNHTFGISSDGYLTISSDIGSRYYIL